MVEGQDRLEILQEKLPDELLEKRFQAVSDRPGVHDAAADALEIGKDRAKALGELIDLVARLSQGQRDLALLSVENVGAELFHGLKVQTHRDNQAAEALRNIPVEARQPLNDQKRPHRHVHSDPKAVLLLLEPAPADQPAVDLVRDQQRLVRRLRGVRRSAFDAPAAGGDHFRKRLAEIVIFMPKRGIGPHDVVDRMRDLLRRRESRNAGKEALMQIQQAGRIKVLVLPRKREKCIVMKVSKQQLPALRTDAAHPNRQATYRIVPFPFSLNDRSGLSTNPQSPPRWNLARGTGQLRVDRESERRMTCFGDAGNAHARSRAGISRFSSSNKKPRTMPGLKFARGQEISNGQQREERPSPRSDS